MVVAPLLSSHLRETAVDFTFPFYTDHTVAVYRTPEGGVATQSYGLFLTPFSWPVWMGLLAAIFFTGTALSITWWFHPFRRCQTSPKVSPSSLQRGKTSSVIPLHVASRSTKITVQTESHVKSLKSKDFAPGPSYPDALIKHIWIIFISFLTQGITPKPVESSVRVIFGFWCIFSLVAYATYSGNLVAFLTVQKSVVPFRTLEELAAHPDFALGTLGTSAWQTLLEETPSGVYNDLWRKVIHSLHSGLTALHPTAAPHLALVKAGGYVFISDTVSVSELVTQNCDIHIMEERFQPVFNAIALQNNSAYRDIISMAIAQFQEFGLLAYWKQIHWARVLPCDGMKGHGAHNPLSVDGVKGVFVFTVVLLLLSVAVLLIERLHKKKEFS